MKRWFFAVVFLGVGVAMTLAAMFVLLRVTLRIPTVANPLIRAAWIGGTLVLGVAALLGAIFLAVRLAVFFFDNRDRPRSDVAG